MIELFEDILGIFRVTLLSIRKDSILLIPYIYLSLMLFAGLALSWQWRELLWYLIALWLSSRSAVKCKTFGEFESVGA